MKLSIFFEYVKKIPESLSETLMNLQAGKMKLEKLQPLIAIFSIPFSNSYPFP